MAFDDNNTKNISPASLFWQHKPWWCQPWSILLTGSLGIAAGILANQWLGIPLWLIAPPVIGILAWWLFFLVIVPTSSSHDS